MIKDHIVSNYKRFKTNYPGVVYRETDRQGKFYYIRYKLPVERGVIEDKLTGIGWTPAKANTERTKRMQGLNRSNSEARAFEKGLKNSELNRPTLKVLWQNYLDSKGDSLRGIVTDKNHWTNHLKDEFGDMTPAELKPMDIDLLRRSISKITELEQ